MKRKLKLGCLGVSGHFLKRVVRPVNASDSCTFVALASRSAEKGVEAASRFDIGLRYDSYAELLQSDAVDAVYIPLPNSMHYAWICRALEAGKHVLCEKPITLTAAEAQDCFKRAEQHGRILMEGFMYRYHPKWRRVKELLDDGEIGAVRSIHTHFSYTNMDAGNIRNQKSLWGGALMDIGCYAVSVPRFLLGREPERVFADMAFDDAFETDRLTCGVLDFGEARATFTVSTQMCPHQSVSIVGSGGRIEVPVAFNSYVDTASSVQVFGAVGHRSVEFPPCDQYALMFEEFAGRIEAKATNDPEQRDAVGNIGVIESLRLSNESETWVQPKVF